MRYIYPITVLLLFATFVTAQSDRFVLRKNGKTIRQFYPGICIYFYNENDQLINGFITQIKSDSIYIEQYDIRQVHIASTGPVFDTVSTYRMSLFFKDIVAVPSDKKLALLTKPAMLQKGSDGYSLTDIVNGASQQKKSSNGQRVTRSGVTLAAFITGYVIQKSKKDYWPIGKKYKMLHLGVTP